MLENYSKCMLVSTSFVHAWVRETRMDHDKGLMKLPFTLDMTPLFSFDLLANLRLNHSSVRAGDSPYSNSFGTTRMKGSSPCIWTHVGDFARLA
jgi:hypothetical protein